MSAVISSTLLSAATARSSGRTSCRKNSRSFSRSPSTVKLFPVAKRSWTTALWRSPPPYLESVKKSGVRISPTRHHAERSL